MQTELQIKDQSGNSYNRVLGDVFSNHYLMPSEYKGEYTKNGGLTKFQPRKWTEKEIDWVMMLKEKGLNTKQIAECIDRDVTQVSIKIKRLGKVNKTYNDPHREEKYKTNEDFFKLINPKSCLDVFSGEHSFWRNIARVYFKIEQLKITEQWDVKLKTDVL